MLTITTIAVIAAAPFLQESSWNHLRQLHQVKIRKFHDANRIDATLGGTPVTLSLANVLPLSAWPKPLTDEQRRVRADAIRFMKKCVEGRGEAFLLTADWTQAKDRFIIRGDLLLRDPAKWKAKTPSELAGGWGIFHINILTIEKGYSVYVKDNTRIHGYQLPLRMRRDSFVAGEEHARKNRSGIWRSPRFAQRLKSTPR